MREKQLSLFNKYVIFFSKVTLFYSELVKCRYLHIKYLLNEKCRLMYKNYAQD